jgi:N-acetylmuramoyl-L-alanine amidase
MTIIQFKKRQTTRFIMLHDSHTTPDINKAVHHLRWKGRKLGLLEIGYHFVIDRDGERTETRPMALVGAACPGFDLETIHICLVGGLDAYPQLGTNEPLIGPSDNFTEAQWEVLFETVRMLKEFYGSSVSFLGHSEARKGRHNSEHGGNCPPVDMGDVRDNYGQWKLMHEGNLRAPVATPSS